MQEAIQLKMDASDSLLHAFLAADTDEQAAISLPAFVGMLDDAGFNFAISDLEVG